MKLINQVTSLALSKKLKKLGVEQKSLWYWTFDISTNKYELKMEKNYSWDGKKKYFPYSAFTVAELGEKLRGNFASWREATGFRCGRLGNTEKLPSTFGDTEANARAKMLIYLKENKLK